MIYIKVPKEISNYETHLALNLTFRQWLYLCASFLLAIALATICYFFIDESLVSYIIIFGTMPGLALGFMKPMDLNCDVYMRYVLNFYKRKQKLSYDNELFIYEIKKEGVNQNEFQQNNSIKEKWKANRAIKQRDKEQRELKETYIPKRIED